MSETEGSVRSGGGRLYGVERRRSTRSTSMSDVDRASPKKKKMNQRDAERLLFSSQSTLSFLFRSPLATHSFADISVPQPSPDFDRLHRVYSVYLPCRLLTLASLPS